MYFVSWSCPVPEYLSARAHTHMLGKHHHNVTFSTSYLALELFVPRSRDAFFLLQKILDLELKERGEVTYTQDERL